VYLLSKSIRGDGCSTDLSQLLSEGEYTNSIFASTSLHNDDLKHEACIGGIRRTENNRIISVSYQNQDIFAQHMRMFNGRIKHLFVDTDKKMPVNLMGNTGTMLGPQYNNLEQVALDFLQESKPSFKVHVWSSSEATVNSALSTVRLLTERSRIRRIALYGLGHIGSKLCLRLVEQGFYVNCSTRDHSKGLAIVNSINLIVPIYTMARASYYHDIYTCAAGCDLLISCTSAIDCIQPEIFLAMSDVCSYIDVGKRNIDPLKIRTRPNQVLTPLRLDITGSIIGKFKELTESPCAKIPQVVVDSKGVRYIEVGYMGVPGDRIVNCIDNIDEPIGYIGSDYRMRPWKS
jgi:hypothetical protein